jgi:hypothetical protein
MSILSSLSQFHRVFYSLSGLAQFSYWLEPGTFEETDEKLAIELDMADYQYCTSLSDKVG